VVAICYAEQVIIRVWISTHFGVISKHPNAANASSRIINNDLRLAPPPVKPFRSINEVSSLPLAAKLVRAPLAPRNPPRSALTTTTRSAQPADAIHHRTLVAARGCCRSCPPAPRRCGHRAAFCGYRTPVSAALSLPSRATEAPPVRKRAALSDLLGYRTSFAREGQHPKVSATRRWYDAPLTRPLRLRGATEARCAGAPYGQSAGQHSSPYGHLADSAASATPPQHHRAHSARQLRTP
jgi:hypothetical protein